MRYFELQIAQPTPVSPTKRLRSRPSPCKPHLAKHGPSNNHKPIRLPSLTTPDAKNLSTKIVTPTAESAKAGEQVIRAATPSPFPAPH
ncbi:MAG TPA: hypothetical protein VJV79_24340, partial [Polyangiaceae bacterium]|nr:hypothetical protein [Polyangiaceae bacterium]